MMKYLLLAGLAVATSLTFPVDNADAFGGRGYARRQARRARRAHYVATPVVVPRVYAAPVVTHYRAPVYYAPPVSVGVSYGTGYYSSGVSVRVGN